VTIDRRRGRRGPSSALPHLGWAGAPLLLCHPGPAQAHVKWFSQVVNCGNTPMSPLQVIGSPLFLALFVAAILTLCGVFLVERRVLQRFQAIQQSHADWKQHFNRSAAWLLRLGVCIYFVSLLAHDSEPRIVLTPELTASGGWVPIAQALIAGLVLFRRTVPLAALGIVGLYAHGVWQEGWFHMLDYVYFLGVAAFLSLDAVFGAALHYVSFTLLRISAGFSFMWVSIEKWLYPQWTFDILERELRGITLGLDLPFFVMSAGMVEFCLAFLLVVGRLSSQVASLILLALMVAGIPLVGLIDAIGHAPLMIVLFIFSASQNRIGYPSEAALRGADIGHVLTFCAAVPGLMGLYVLSHAAAYPSVREWLSLATLAGLVMALPLVWRVGRIRHRLFPMRQRHWQVASSMWAQSA